MTSASAEWLRFETIIELDRFVAFRSSWNDLVRSMPRPSPFLLVDWLAEWWRHYGAGGEPRVEVALRGDQVVAALPLFVRSYAGVRVASFLGGGTSALADLLLADGEDRSTARSLAQRAASSGFHLVDLFGLPADSVLAASAGRPLHLIQRVEAPVLDLDRGWDVVYRERTSSKQRNQHKRRRRQLSELGKLDVVLARSLGELEPALEDAFALHARRWEGRPDGSGFVTPAGQRFHRDALQALARADAARIMTLKLDGRAIAFHYYFVLRNRMYVHRLAFDPALSKYSPGLVNTLDAIEAASAEGLTRVEFLGGAERYKTQLADRLEPLYQGVGMAGGAVGAILAAQRLGAIRLRSTLKRSPRLHRFYLDGLAPTRRLIDGIRQRTARDVGR